jgi:pimeloyl-ACP methyl ester carboxylesterase
MASELSTKEITDITNEEINDMRTMLLNSNSGSGFITDLEHDLEEDMIRKINVPTLVVHSTNDKAVSREHPLHAKENIKNSKLIWIDNSWGHMIWFDKKAVDNINSFLINDST